MRGELDLDSRGCFSAFAEFALTTQPPASTHAMANDTCTSDLHRIASFRATYEEIVAFRTEAETRWAEAQAANEAAEAAAREAIRTSWLRLKTTREERGEACARSKYEDRLDYCQALINEMIRADAERKAHDELVKSLHDPLQAALATARTQYEADCREADEREEAAKQALAAAVEQPVIDHFAALLKELLDVKQALAVKTADLESSQHRFEELLSHEKERAAAVEEAFKDTLVDVVRRRADALMDAEKRHVDALAAAETRHAAALEAVDAAHQLAVREAVEGALMKQREEINALKREKEAALANAAAQAKKRKQWMKKAREADERARRAEMRAFESDSEDSELDSEDDSEEDDDECCVCMDSFVNAKLTPCGHREMCMKCATLVRDGGCPTCRRAVTDVIEA